MTNAPIASASGGLLLDLRSVAAGIGGVPILHDVSLMLAEGEILGLLGPNGAGKTTTLSVALGLVAPSSGSVRVLGCDPFLDGARVRALTGILPERGGFYGWMTAPAYLAFFARLHGIEPGSEKIAEHLARVSLMPRSGQRIETFSHGMRQRLGLARALLADPRLLLLDEPTSGLDPRGRREVHDLLRGLARGGVGILLSTHLLDDVERLCDRIVIIAAGATVAAGMTRELAGTAGDQPRRGGCFRLQLSEPGEMMPLPEGVVLIAREDGRCTVEIAEDETPEAAWRELMFLGWRVREIHRVEDDGSALERLYLRLTENCHPARDAA